MKKYFLYSITIMVFSSLMFAACKKEYRIKEKEADDKLITINVSNVDQLYAAVNDPANAKKRIVLAPGTYILNASFPNGGRLELQEDMELQGKNGHPDQVIIDESSLPSASFSIPPIRTGGIRLGRGTNTLEWLTIKGSAAGLSVIDTDLPSTETYIKIFHVNIIGNGSSIGIDIRNVLPEEAGRKIYAELAHNDITGNTTLLGPGVEVQNSNGASGSLIKVNLKNNNIHGNRVGLGAFQNGASSSVINSRIEVTSYADRIEENGVGMYVGGGASQVPAAIVNGNTTIIEVHGSSIRNNNPVPLPAILRPDVPGFTPCGIYMFGGRSSNIQGNNKASDNTLRVSFWGSDIADNNLPHVLAFGAWCQPQALLAGTNNLVEVYLNGVSKKATVEATPSFPTEPAGTNMVNIFR
ncbi:MAG TPA: hypothetical protein VNA26_01630 [Chitinophagaceae bacterium]|nr:hypothetical protein [Chitinophagaceae bacterium]